MKTGRETPKWVRCVIWVTCMFVTLVTIGLLWVQQMIASAERSGDTSGLDFKVDMMVRRVRTFQSAAGRRNKRCGYADVWALSPPVQMVVARRALLKTFRTEKHDGAFDLIGTPSGSYWIPNRDLDTLAETLAEQQADVYEGAVGVKAGDIVLDCGANVGAYTRHALERGAKLVVAIEMAPESLECLRRNLANEIASRRVLIYPKGVWNKDDVLQLSMSPEWASTASSVALDRGGHGPTVPLTTIDKLVSELNLPSVDFIKMDIEGAEMQALEGARETVRRFHPRMAISTEHRPTDPDQIPQVVHNLWPDYMSQCGPCANVNGSIQPDVLFAHSR